MLQELGLILQADEMNCNRVLCCIVDQKRNRKTIYRTVVTGATETHKSIVMQPTSPVTLKNRGYGM